MKYASVQHCSLYPHEIYFLNWYMHHSEVIINCNIMFRLWLSVILLISRNYSSTKTAKNKILKIFLKAVYIACILYLTTEMKSFPWFRSPRGSTYNKKDTELEGKINGTENKSIEYIQSYRSHHLWEMRCIKNRPVNSTHDH